MSKKKKKDKTVRYEKVDMLYYSPTILFSGSRESVIETVNKMFDKFIETYPDVIKETLTMTTDIYSDLYDSWDSDVTISGTVPKK